MISSYKKMTFAVVLVAFFAHFIPVMAQMPQGGTDTLYGNEWIQAGQSYYKIAIPANGMYRITGLRLRSAGITSINADKFQLWRAGKQIPIFTSTNGTMSDADFMDFYGEKNSSDLDKYLYTNTGDMLNPYYSIITDTMSYYLTWNNTVSTARYSSVPNDLSSPPVADSVFTYTLRSNYSDVVIKPDIGSGVYTPQMMKGEGYGTPIANARTLNLGSVFPFMGDTSKRANVFLKITGDEGSHVCSTAINRVPLGKDTFFGYTGRDIRKIARLESLDSGLVLRVVGALDGLDRYSIGYVEVTYPRQFNFTGLGNVVAFTLDESVNPRYLEIRGFSGTTPVLYDQTNKIRISATVESGVVKVLLPASTNKRNLILYGANAIQTIATLNSVSLDNSLSVDGGTNYLILTHPSLRTGATDQVQAYANYRGSAAGGGFTTKIVDINQIYEQFGYGVARHPSAVRNFLAYVKKRWANPQFILLMGKGINYFDARTNAENIAQMAVPTYGYPGSDNMLISKSNISANPQIPLGRLSFFNPDEIKIYLEKMIEFETTQKNGTQTYGQKDWQKYNLHLSGGQAEAEIIKLYMNGFASQFNNGKGGITTASFYRNSSDPIAVPNTEKIFQRINQGVSHITFFGHSSATGLDFNIDNPDELNNQGKYPFMVALGCSAGNIYTPTVSISENFTRKRGEYMIGFAGTSGSSFLSSLSFFGTEYYKQLGTDSYGKSIGEVVKNTLNNLEATNPSSGLRSVIQEFNINADPAIKIYYAPGADYVVNTESVKFGPNMLNTQLDSFDITFSVTNLGQVVNDSMVISVRHELPNGILLAPKKVKIKSPVYEEAITLRFPMPRGVAAGQNRMQIKVDEENRITELPAPQAEQNNDATVGNAILGIPFFIADNSVTPVVPYEFAIVNDPNIVLKATTNPVFGVQKYLMELDTLVSFNSGAKMRTEISQKGGVIKWTPAVTWVNNKVYYWRVSTDSISPQQSFNWQNSSFIYESGSSVGWSQSEGGQYKENKLRLMEVNEVLKGKSLDFATNVVSYNFIPTDATSFGIGRNNGFYQPYYDYQRNINVWMTNLDEKSLIGVLNTEENRKKFGGYKHPSNFIFDMFYFDANLDTDSLGRKGIKKFIDNVPDSNYVFFIGFHPYNSENWGVDSINGGQNLFQVLEKQGAKTIRTTQNAGSPLYMYIFKKGVNGGRKIYEYIYNPAEKGIDKAFILDGRWFEGEMESKLIGPASEWQSLELNLNSSDNVSPTDTVKIALYGVGADRVTETLLANNLTVGQSLSTISINDYPYLKLKYNANDNSKRTPTQLSAWKVRYKGVPEVALNGAANYTITGDTIEQGQQMKIRMAIENIGSYDTDSLLFKYSLTTDQNAQRDSVVRFKKMKPGDIVVADYNLSTRAMKNRNLLVLEANPNNDQPEQTHINNLAQIPFVINTDIRNPLLDVTFDGLHILNGDMVSSNPKILIALKDENKYQGLNDTSLFRILLKNPNGTTERIALDGIKAKFFPADANNLTKDNTAKVEFEPTLTTDGTYELTIQAKDASGNSIGQSDYKVSFNVENKSAITNLLNYPNPFSTSTQFVYTLSGQEPPAFYKIQIMTMSGKIVREITHNEIGQLKVGTHRTDYAWDGRDEYGDKLANGVYLYRFLAKKANGEDFEKNDDRTAEKDRNGNPVAGTGIDRFFKGGFGKLVIVR